MLALANMKVGQIQVSPKTKQKGKMNKNARYDQKLHMLFMIN